MNSIQRGCLYSASRSRTNCPKAAASSGVPRSSGRNTINAIGFTSPVGPDGRMIAFGLADKSTTLAREIAGKREAAIVSTVLKLVAKQIGRGQASLAGLAVERPLSSSQNATQNVSLRSHRQGFDGDEPTNR